MRNKLASMRDGDRGFVLIVVLWGLGVILVLAASFAVTTRSYTKSTGNRIINAQAQAHAETGVHLALMALLAAGAGKPETAPPIPLNGKPYVCQISPDATLAITVEDEGGKVDLNGASQALLTQLFEGAGADPERAEAITAALLDFRDADDERRDRGAEKDDYIAAGLPFGPKNGPLHAPEELEQVFGVDTELHRMVRSVVTVYSRRSGIDPSVAPLSLLAMLTKSVAPDQIGGNTERQRKAHAISRAFVTPSDKSAFTIRVEVHRPTGGVFVRESVVELPRSRQPAFRYLAWRRGDRSASNIVQSTIRPNECLG